MKITTNKQPVYGTVVDESRDFGIKFDEKAYTILSSGLYKHKIRAFVRELSCNAIDGHIALEKIGGTPPKYFDVELPSEINYQWRLRDYGIGMDRNGIFDLFTTYFASTKEDSDDFIGAFGLGSKSPFCYTTTFTVTSWFGGLKTVYSIFMNNGKPKCVPIFEEPSDDHSGIEIVIPIDQEDISELKQEVRAIYHTFDLEGFYPNIINNNFELTNYKKQGYYGSLMENGVYAVMGGVSYKIPSKFYEDSVCSVFYKSSYNYIDFPVGSLNPLPNREELSLDKHTLTTLNNYFESLSNRIIEDVHVLVEKNNKDARSKIRAILGMSFGEHIFGKVSKLIKHNDKTLDEWYRFYESFTSTKEWLVFKDFCADVNFKNKNFVMMDTFSKALRNVWSLERARYYGATRKIDIDKYYCPSIKHSRFPYPIILSGMDGKWKERIKVLMKYGIIPNERSVIIGDSDPYYRPKVFKNVTRNLFIQIANRYHKDDIDIFDADKLYRKHCAEIEQKEQEEKRIRRLESQQNRVRVARVKVDNSHYHSSGIRNEVNILAKEVPELSGMYGLRAGEYITVDGVEISPELQSWLSEVERVTLYALPKTLERRASMNDNLKIITMEQIKKHLKDHLDKNMVIDNIGWNVAHSNRASVDIEQSRQMLNHFNVDRAGNWDSQLLTLYTAARVFFTEEEYAVYENIVKEARQLRYDEYHKFYDNMKAQFPMEYAILRIKKSGQGVRSDEYDLATSRIMENYKGV